MSFSLRAATPDDEPLLRELYRTSRLDEVSAWGWTSVETEAFLLQQWQVAQRARPLQLPDAEDSIILVEGEAVGRLLLDRRTDAVHVADIALLPAARARGLGTEVLRGVIEEARPLPVELEVQPASRAKHLYERLGFRTVGEPMPFQSLRLLTA